jgi:hypothetical protein
LLIGAMAVPALLGGGVAASLHLRSGDEPRIQPSVNTSTVAPSLARPRPRIYPTYGEFVPPRPVVTPTRTAPVVDRPRRPMASPRPSCPSGWKENPWLRRWCRTHGFETNDS